MSDDKKENLNSNNEKGTNTIIPGTNLLLQEYIKAKMSNDEEQYEMTSELLRNQMLEILSNAIKQFYTNDIELFRLHSEESLSGRIAHYIECQLREGDYCGYYADVEYAFMDSKKSKKSSKQYGDVYINSREYYDNNGNPDAEPNEKGYNADFLMVIEVKREDEKDKNGEDKKRLLNYISPKKPRVKEGEHRPIYGALMGVFLRLKEEEGATADLYYNKSLSKKKIMWKQVTYNNKNLYYPQIGEELDYEEESNTNSTAATTEANSSKKKTTRKVTTKRSTSTIKKKGQAKK